MQRVDRLLVVAPVVVALVVGGLGLRAAAGWRAGVLAALGGEYDWSLRSQLVQGGTQGVTMISASNSICFLARVEFEEWTRLANTLRVMSR